MRLVRDGFGDGGGLGESILNVTEVTEGTDATDVMLRRIAESVGTPAYVYDAEAIRTQYLRLDGALAPVPHKICYSVKANGNLSILRLLRGLGSGVDIVSAGELARAMKAGFKGADVVFSGVGKTADELRAALDANVGMINVESEEELDVLAAVAQQAGKAARVAIRVNPDVKVDVHPYTATGAKGMKFGVPIDEAEALALRSSRTKGLVLVGLAMHIGSGIKAAEPFVEAVLKMLELVASVRKAGVTTLESLDIGGGLGIRYSDDDRPLEVDAWASAVLPHVATAGLTIVVEPGRFLVGNAGVLLTRVMYRKKSGGRMIAIVDAGMTDLIRPSHYQAYHRISVVGAQDRPEVSYDVVGPICESGDFFAIDRTLPELAQGDLVVLHGAGAYGFVMTSTYNARPRPPEVMLDGDAFRVIRERESIDDLMRGES